MLGSHPDDRQPDRQTRKWTWGSWYLHLGRACVAASLWLAVLAFISPRAEPVQAQSSVCKYACDLLDVACDVTGFLDSLGFLGGLFVPTPHDQFDFRWRPFCRYPPPFCWVGGGDDDPGTDVMTAVNVQTFFWATGDLVNSKTYFRVLPGFPIGTYGTAYTLKWTPIAPPQWCFGDGNCGVSLTRHGPGFRFDLVGSKFNPTGFEFPVQWYEFSSYGQPHRTAQGQPAFEATIITEWELEIDYVVTCIGPYGILIPFCSFGTYGPYWPIPICKDHPVAVKQVQSVLVPSPWFPLPLE